jgi:hypothetical protein
MYEAVYRVIGKYKTEIHVIKTSKGFLVLFGGNELSVYKRLENAIRSADKMAKV